MSGKIVMGKEKGVAFPSKKDIGVWDKIGDFLPENFERVLEKIRAPSGKRFKSMGIGQSELSSSRGYN